MQEPTDGEAEPGEDLRIYASKRKALFWVVLSAGMLVAAVLAVASPAHLDGFQRIFVLVGGLPLAGGALILFGSVLLSNAPRLVVTHEGIQVSSRLLRDAVIPWSLIKELSLQDTRLQTTLRIALRNPSRIRAWQTVLQRRISRVLPVAYLTYVVLSVSDLTLPLPMMEVVACIRARFGREIERYGVQVT